MMKTPMYTTKSGIKIGSAYVPPLRTDFTHEERFAQRLMLGDIGYSNREKLHFAGYTAALAVFLFFLTSVGGTVLAFIIGAACGLALGATAMHLVHEYLDSTLSDKKEGEQE